MINQYAMGIKAFFFNFFFFRRSAGHFPRKLFGSASQVQRRGATSHRLLLQNLIFDLFVPGLFDGNSCRNSTTLNGAAVKKRKKVGTDGKKCP